MAVTIITEVQRHARRHPQTTISFNGQLSAGAPQLSYSTCSDQNL